MPYDHNLFAGKLGELDAQYTQMISRIKLCHKGTPEEIAKVKNELWEECRMQEGQLEKMTSDSRSEAVAAMSSIQLHYFRDIRRVMETKLPQQLDGLRLGTGTSRAEAMALYAEFAMDTTVQSMRYALYAALSAVELQSEAERDADS